MVPRPARSDPRHAYHEITEETQHSMMFQELINRSGFDPAPSSEEIQVMFRKVADFGRRMPVLFFLYILAAEETFDFAQRKLLRSLSTHPLLRKICRIHCVEEARHLSFAREYLRRTIPQISSRERRLLCYQAPFVVTWTARRMLESPIDDKAFAIPDDVRADLLDRPQIQALRTESTAKVVALCHDLGLVDPRFAPLWPRAGH